MAYAPTTEDQEALEYLLGLDNVGTREAEFLEGLLEQTYWTPKQKKWFDDICERRMGA